MELLAFGTLVGLGYLAKNDDLSFRELDKTLINVKTNEKTHNNVYDSNYFPKSLDTEYKLSKKKFNKSKNPINTNIIPRNFNDRVINNKTTPIKYLQNEYKPIITDRPIHDRQKKYKTSCDKVYSNLTNSYMDKNEFSHNNMVPFFRGDNKQNVDPFANHNILEAYQGLNNYTKPKEAVEPMFKKTKNLTYVNGTPNFSDSVTDRYIPSMYRQNETPIDSIHVGPGLNDGYSSNPIGGFQQFEAQTYALPKTTDEIRTIDNPKVSYEGRVTGPKGAIVQNRGLQADVEKKLPNRYYVQTPDMYFKTTGAFLKPEFDSEYNAKDTNRQNSIAYDGIAGPSTTYAETLRPEVKISTNQNFKSDWQRNATLEDKGNIEFDYSKNSYTVKPNERESTEDKNPATNLTTTVKNIIAPLLDVFRTTRKENVIGNPNKTGYMSAPTKTIVYDPNSVARTTLKETNIHNNHNGHLSGSTKGSVYDPNSVMRTTIKETNIHNNHSGQLSGVNKGTVYDPNSVMRTTIKETNIHNDHSGHLTGSTKASVYDPNSVMRTTIKETNIHNNYSGQLSGVNKGTVYDPNSVAKTTLKETNIHNNYSGQLSSVNKGTVYDPNNIMRTTVKETNIHNNYSGQLSSVNKGTVYDPNSVAKTTLKETNIHNTHSGQLSGVSKGTIYDPNSIMRTTVKETNIHNTHSGQLSGVNKGSVYDPNSVAKTTLKETNIHNNYSGQLSGVSKGTVYDPNSVAKTTLKETNIHNTHSGQLSGVSKGTVYDPNSIAKTTLKETNIHNTHSGQLSSVNKGSVYDPNSVMRTTVKETNIHNTHSGQLSGVSKGSVYDPNSVMRTTVKETNIHNNHSGQLSGVSKGSVYDPNSVMRTTVKETNIHNNHSGQLSGSTKSTVYDPNSIMRTTIKETNIHNNHSGQLSGLTKSKVYDPNSVMRTTVKETNIHNTHTGNINVPKKVTVQNPYDTAKTTIKETNIHNNHTGNLGSVKKGTVYDPNSIAKTTIKETNIHNSRTGNVGSTTYQNGDGYMCENFEDKITNRQFTSDNEYTGIADGQTGRGNGDGYMCENFEDKATNRQYTSDFEYMGVADSYLDKPMSEEMYKVARLNETKTGVSEGRYPTLSNVKVANGSDTINMETKKLDIDRENQYTPIGTRLYTQTPVLTTCTVTTDKNRLDDESLNQRIDPEILEAFNNNPYTQPLNSSA
jgi:hypothetical protein